MKRLKFLFILVFLFATPGSAADYVYTPTNCEFKMTYPEQPSIAQACNPENPKDCYEASNFTRVLAMDSSVRINTTCNNAEPGMLERYSGDVMQYTLGTMAHKKVDEYESGFNDHGIAKQAVVLGNQKLDDGTEQVYMAQIWIGKKSVFTIEGQVTGNASPEADAIFSEIFKSIRHESWDKPAESVEKTDEKGKKKKDEDAE